MNDTGIRLRHVIAEICDDIAPDSICIDQQLQEHLGLDSLDRVELMMAVEDEFNIVFTDQADEDRVTAPTTTVKDLLEAVEQQLAAAGVRA